MKRRCILERRAAAWTNGRSTFAEIWHIVPTGFEIDEDATFAQILCGQADGTGITFPGPISTETPTCPECETLARRRAQPAATWEG